MAAITGPGPSTAATGGPVMDRTSYGVTAQQATGLHSVEYIQIGIAYMEYATAHMAASILSWHTERGSPILYHKTDSSLLASVPGLPRCAFLIVRGRKT